MKHRLPKNLAILALLGNTILWGIALPIVKLGINHGLTPSALLVVRYLLAILFSLPIIFLFRKRPDFKHTLKPSSVLKIVILELSTTVLALFTLYQGLALSSAINASIIESIKPLIIIFGGILFLKENENRNEIYGLVLTLLGTFLIIFSSNNSTHGASTIGNLLLISFLIFDSAYFLIAKHLYHDFNKWVATHISFYVCLFGFTAIGLYTHQLTFETLKIATSFQLFWPLFACFYMALFGSVIGLTLYHIGQDAIEASEAAIFTYVRPIFTIPVSIILIGETISFYHLAAFFLIILGVLVTQKRPTKA